MRTFMVLLLVCLVAACGNKDNEADRRTAALKGQAEAAFAPVNGTVSFLQARDFVDADEFHRLAQDFGVSSPITVLSWAPRVTQEERGDKRILQPTADNQLVPMDERPDYLPILYQERFDDEALTLGFDLQALPDRKEMIGKARDAKTPIMLQPPKRAFRPTAMPVYSILWPVFRKNVYIGVVSGLVPADKMLAYLMKDAPAFKGGIAFFSRHGEDIAQDVPVMIWRDGKFQAATEALGSPPAGATRIQRQFSLYGLDWLLVFDFGN